MCKDNKDIERRQTQWQGQCICYMCKDNKDIERRQSQWRGQCICYMCKDNKDIELRQAQWQGQCICYMCKDKIFQRNQNSAFVCILCSVLQICMANYDTEH